MERSRTHIIADIATVLFLLLLLSCCSAACLEFYSHDWYPTTILIFYTLLLCSYYYYVYIPSMYSLALAYIHSTAAKCRLRRLNWCTLYVCIKFLFDCDKIKKKKRRPSLLATCWIVFYTFVILRPIKNSWNLQYKWGMCTSLVSFSCFRYVYLERILFVPIP